MSFLNKIFDCCFRSKEFKLHPKIEKEFEEEKEVSKNAKDKEKEIKSSKTPQDKGTSEITKDKGTPENSKDKEKKSLETIKDTPKDKNELSPIGSSEENFSALNATLQCLSNINELTNYFRGTFPKIPEYEKKVLSYKYYKLIQNLENENSNNKISHSSLIEFKEKLSEINAFLSKQVEINSVDLFITLLSNLHGELNINKSNGNSINHSNNQNYNEAISFKVFSDDQKVKNNSIIFNLFSLVSENINKCTNCYIQQYNFSILYNIEFHLKTVNEFLINYGMRNNYNMSSNQKPSIHIAECFQYYNGNYGLNSQMFCNNCLNEIDHITQNNLYSLPKYLIINFNRGFDYDIFDYNVIFPDLLNLDMFAKENSSNTKLELFAVICDTKESSSEKHFVAYCKNQENKNWYLYDSDNISSCENPSTNHKGMVYILFYKAFL